MKKGIHVHSFTGVRDELSVPPGVVLVESGLSGFEHEFSEALAYPFNAVGEHVGPEDHTVIIDLPYEEMVVGKGKGYVLDLMDYLSEEYAFERTRLYDIKFPDWGCPVLGRRLLLVASNRLVSLISPMCNSSLTAILPDVAFHAPAAQKRGIMHPGFYSMFGYTNSAGSVLPPVSSWVDKYPLCEKRSGDTLRVSRLSREDIYTLWGYLPPHDSPAILMRLSPIMVLRRVSREIKLPQK